MNGYSILARNLAFAICLFGTGCGAPAEAPLEPPLALNAELRRNVTSTLTTTPDGGTAQVWTTVGEGDNPGRLFALIGLGGRPVELRDPDAIPVFDPETPPQIAAGPDGAWYIAYPATNDVTDSWGMMAIRVVRSTDGGKTWSEPTSVGAGDAFGGYRNDHELAIGPDGALYSAWVDNRFGGDEGHSVIAISRSDDRGATWTSPAPIDDTPSCECCRVALAVAEDGTVVAAWRKIIDGHIRDIVTARSTDRGATWSAPERVHADAWQVDYCPDAGPAMAFDDQGRLHLAWWTGAPGAAGVRYARSADLGHTFTDIQEMKIGEMSRASHVQIALDGNRVAVVWEDATLESPRIALRVSDDQGRSFGPLRYLSEGGQRAAYPQVTSVDNRWLVLWHQRADDTRPTRTTAPDEPLWMTHDDFAAPQMVRLMVD